ncbi:hypothetical protein EV182_008083, partial [Spiromyces aspiralis]
SPFSVIDVERVCSEASLWTRLQFLPPAGNLLLLSTATGPHYIIDTISTNVVAELRFTGPRTMSNPAAVGGGSGEVDVRSELDRANHGQGICVAPDGKSVLMGLPSGRVCIWDISGVNGDSSSPRDTEGGRGITVIETNKQWDGVHASAVNVCGFNPVYMMAVTGGDSL